MSGLPPEPPPELPPEVRERHRLMQQYNAWRRANTVTFVAWLLVVALLYSVLTNWLPNSGRVLLFACVLAVLPAWGIRRAFTASRKN